GRKGIENRTKTCHKVIVDRSKELRSWVDVCQRALKRGVSTFVYANDWRGLEFWQVRPRILTARHASEIGECEPEGAGKCGEYWGSFGASLLLDRVIGLEG
ncbi:MAG: hypothetical protein WA734_09050, partial [Candidatus Acidiferrales bacterium]